MTSMIEVRALFLDWLDAEVSRICEFGEIDSGCRALRTRAEERALLLGIDMPPFDWSIYILEEETTTDTERLDHAIALLERARDILTRYPDGRAWVAAYDAFNPVPSSPPPAAWRSTKGTP